MYILTDNEIKEHIDNLMTTLLHYNFDDVSNLLFYDLHSFQLYLENNADNPFMRQCIEVEAVIKVLYPYICAHHSQILIPMLSELDDLSTEAGLLFLHNIYLSAILEFIDDVQNIKNEDDFNHLFNLCCRNKQLLLDHRKVHR